MKATTLLKNQHADVQALFAKAEKQLTGAKATSEKIIKSLLAHMLIEEELFYPAVRDVDVELVIESFEEHATARFEMQRVGETDGSNEAFHPRLTTLRELIEHHVEEEHDDLFPKADKALTAEQNETLCIAMQVSFDDYMKRPIAELFEKVEIVAPRPSSSRAA